jgi:Histidine kinase-, DNA gyrase B-, and HSP90-like ATPase
MSGMSSGCAPIIAMIRRRMFISIGRRRPIPPRIFRCVSGSQVNENHSFWSSNSHVLADPTAFLITVSLKGTDHDICLSIQDEGIGFDAAEVRKKSGLGLSSMRERVRIIRGELRITSEPEKGTTIKVNMPLKVENED